MSTNVTPAPAQPNAAVNQFITSATGEINAYLPAAAEGLQNIATILNTPGMSHLSTAVGVAASIFQAAAATPNPTVEEVAGFGSLITGIFGAIVSLFSHPATAPTTAQMATVAPAIAAAAVPAPPAIAPGFSAAAPVAAPAPAATPKKENFFKAVGEAVAHPIATAQAAQAEAAKS